MSEERRLAAIVFSDICGFSKVMGVDEKKALSFVSLHNQAMESGTEQYGGRIIKKMGDGLMAEFSSAVNAVRCSLAVQAAINDYNSGCEDTDKIFIRIGIHLGDVVVSETGDLLGDGVNVASRIEPLAEPGGICISRDILDLVENKMAIQTVHLGAKDLKNISKQINIYKILVDAVAKEGAGTSPELLATQRKAKRETGRPWLRYGLIAAAIVLIGIPTLLVVGKQVRMRRTEATKQAVTERCLQFFKALDGAQWDEATNYLDPAEVREQGAERIRGRLKFFTGFMRVGGMSAAKAKITNVDLAGDEKTASLTVSVYKKNAQGKDEWQPMKTPSLWQLVDGQWFTVSKPKPGGSKGPAPTQGRPGGRPRPFNRR